MQVNVTPEESEILQKLCFMKGMTWGDNSKTVQYTNMKGLEINGGIYYQKGKFSAKAATSFWKAIQEISNLFLVGGYTVFFKKGHLEIGCQTVPNKVVREILAKLS